MEYPYAFGLDASFLLVTKHSWMRQMEQYVGDLTNVAALYQYVPKGKTVKSVFMSVSGLYNHNY